MKHRQYCCDATRDLYEEYYSRQNGGEIPVFAGRRFQRGHGLGSILGGFIRRLVLPFFKTNAKSMLKMPRRPAFSTCRSLRHVENAGLTELSDNGYAHN